jgi:phosphoglycolate phosphatase
MVLIDLDGTLIDSVPDLTYCVDADDAELDRPPRGEAAVRDWVGNGVERLVQRALVGHAGRRAHRCRVRRGPTRSSASFTPTTTASARISIRACARGWTGCAPHAAIGSAASPIRRPLHRAAARGLGPRGRLRDRHQRRYAAGEEAEPAAPAACGGTLRGRRAEWALMVGDSVSDVKAARAAGFQHHLRQLRLQSRRRHPRGGAGRGHRLDDGVGWPARGAVG